jgi:hypothetical protein
VSAGGLPERLVAALLPHDDVFARLYAHLVMHAA